MGGIYELEKRTISHMLLGHPRVLNPTPAPCLFPISGAQVDAQASCTKFTQSNLYALQLKFFCTTKWILFVCVLALVNWQLRTGSCELRTERATEEIALHKNLGKLVEKFAFEQNFKLMKWKSTSQLRLCLASVRLPATTTEPLSYWN